MVDVQVGFNSEGVGWRKVRMEFTRVPVEGEKLEFWNPDGSAANVDEELDGRAFYVEDVTWVCYSGKATPIIHIEPKGS